MEKCVFCKIIKKEIGADIVYEDKKFLAFLDISPVSNGHLLVIPKNHVEWMQDVDDETLADSFKLCKKLMLAIKKGLGGDYVMVSVVGKDVPHFHIHLIPRMLDDNKPQFETKKYKEGEIQEVVQKIKTAIA